MADCCCIIPCYNEASRIGGVLNDLTQIRGINHILCVDDGSTDGTAAVIIECFPQVELLVFHKNQGKAAAVLQGALHTSSEYILLVDADLQNIYSLEFERAIETIQRNPEIDMLILRRVNKGWVTRLLRGDMLITGERIVSRQYLLDTLKDQPVVGFQLEVALNQYMLETHRQVRWLPVSSVGVASFRKLGFWSALGKELRMFADLFSYLGWRNLARQYFWVGQIPVATAISPMSEFDNRPYPFKVRP